MCSQFRALSISPCNSPEALCHSCPLSINLVLWLPLWQAELLWGVDMENQPVTVLELGPLQVRMLGAPASQDTPAHGTAREFTSLLPITGLIWWWQFQILGSPMKLWKQTALRLSVSPWPALATWGCASKLRAASKAGLSLSWHYPGGNSCLSWEQTTK